MARTIGLILVLLTACSAAVSSPSEEPVTLSPDAGTPSPQPAPSTDGVLELGSAGEPLEPGRYTRNGFIPRITLELGDGWTAEQSAPGFFDIQRGAGTLDVVAVQFGRVTGHASGDDAVAAMTDNPQLSIVEGPEPTTVDGVDGARLVVDTADGPETQPPVFRPVLTVEAGPLSIASNRRLEVRLFDTSDGVLAILVGGSIRAWDEAVAAAQPILASVTIGE